MSTVVPNTSLPVLSLENLLFDYPEADIILRSGDSHEFRVLKIYITHSSPVLSDRVTASTRHQPGATTSVVTAVAPLPIVQLSDSGVVLFSLLTYIFPVQPILPSDVEHIINLLSAAQRYRMDAVLTHIRNHIAQQGPLFIHEENSLLAFSLARKHNLIREGFQAARSTLELPTFTIESLEERVEIMPCASLYALWQYRQCIRTKFTSLVENRISGYRTLKGSSNSGCTHPVASGSPAWLDRYVSSVGSNPSFLNLSRFHMASRDHVRSSSKANCRRCFHCATMDIPKLWAVLKVTYDACITEAESNLLLAGCTRFEAHTKRIGKRVSQYRHLNMPNADVILRSSDLVDFRVNRSAFVASSPFFGDMFSLPQSSHNEAVDGLPLVRCPEDASVLNSLISMVYSVPPEIPNSDDAVITLLAACQKYDMATVQSSIRAEIRRRGLLSPTGAESFRLFAVASSKGLIPEMEATAIITLEHPMTFEFLGDALRSFEPWALRKLARFRQYCQVSLISCLWLLSKKQLRPSRVWVGCPKADDNALPDWLEMIFLTKTRASNTFEHPLPFVKPSSFREEYLAALRAHVRENNCTFCMKTHTLKGEDFCTEVEKRLAQAWDIKYVSRDDLPGVRAHTTRAVSAPFK